MKIIPIRPSAAADSPGKKPMRPLFSRIFGIWTVALIAATLAVTVLTMALTRYDRTNPNDLVIVLDPGHGGSDVGASNTALGLYESEINLKIALACRDRLRQYDGIRVYMTHTGVRSEVAKSSLSSRVSVAGEVGADIFISLHINSAEHKDANGAEVYVPITTHEPKYHEECSRLADGILTNLQALGLGSRGVKTRASGGGRVYTFDDGTSEKGDYYYVIGEPISRLGIPGILVEHAFIDGDSSFLDTDAKLTALGVADAEAIARHYGLTLKTDAIGISSFTSDDVSSHTPDISSDISSDDSDISSDVMISSEPDTSEPDNSSSSVESTVSSEPLAVEEETDPAVLKVESMIRDLPDPPGSKDGAAVGAARRAFIALSESGKNAVDTALYQKLCRVVTIYENLTHPIRFMVKDGSEMSIDRVTGQLLHAETARQQSRKITVFSIMMEMELFIDPDVPDEYKQEGILSYRVTAPDGTPLESDDEVSDGTTISVWYNDLRLDTLTVSIRS